MKIVGHRGARGLAPENTLESIQKALDLGVDEIEIDVRVTSDGIPILCHDPSLLRFTGQHLMIGHHTHDNLKAAKDDLCTLESAINYINKRVPIVIEVKPRQPTAPVIALVASFLERGWNNSDFLVGSKSQRTLKELHAGLPSIPTVVIARFLSVWAQHRARQVGARRLSMNQHFVWFGFVKYISRKYDLVPYTLNDPAKARRWEKYGLAGCVTDVPDLYKKNRS